jgi:hypothetical protein
MCRMLCKGIEFTLGLPTTAAKWTCVKKIAQRHTLLAAAQMSYRAGNTVVRPERFELPASWFVARRSIQLSYGRALTIDSNTWRRGRDSNPRWAFDPYALSRGAPSTTRPPLP